MKCCKNIDNKKYTGKENTPLGKGYHAEGQKTGDRKKGKDGKWYVVVEYKNGKRWKMLNINNKKYTGKENHAEGQKIGDKKKGKDGKWYVVVEYKNGKRWKMLNTKNSTSHGWLSYRPHSDKYEKDKLNSKINFGNKAVHLEGTLDFVNSSFEPNEQYAPGHRVKWGEHILSTRNIFKDLQKKFPDKNRKLTHDPKGHIVEITPVRSHELPHIFNEIMPKHGYALSEPIGGNFGHREPGKWDFLNTTKVGYANKKANPNKKSWFSKPYKHNPDIFEELPPAPPGSPPDKPDYKYEIADSYNPSLGYYPSYMHY